MRGDACADAQERVRNVPHFEHFFISLKVRKEKQKSVHSSFFSIWSTCARPQCPAPAVAGDCVQIQMHISAKTAICCSVKNAGRRPTAQDATAGSPSARDAKNLWAKDVDADTRLDSRSLRVLRVRITAKTAVTH